MPGDKDLARAADIITEHYRAADADLMITLCEGDRIPTEVFTKDMHVAAWLPVDTSTAPQPDTSRLKAAGVVQVAMSRHGWRALQLADAAPLHVPHGIDTSVFRPRDRDDIRSETGIDPGTFLIGICATNNDLVRKGFQEQFLAFAQFRDQHPDSALIVHSPAHVAGALDLVALADACGIVDATYFPDPDNPQAMRITTDDMADWYSMLDLLSAASYGEGFGLPVIEAQACGIPVVVTSASAMPEHVGAGWAVSGEPFWVAKYRSWWTRPSWQEIAAAYENAWLAREEGSMKVIADHARAFAMNYDADTVMSGYWEPALAEIAERLGIRRIP